MKKSGEAVLLRHHVNPDAGHLAWQSGYRPLYLEKR